MRDYADHVRTATLDSVVAPDAGGIVTLVETAERSFAQLVAGCVDDPACSAAFPDFPNALERAYEQLDAQPFEGEADLGEDRGVVPLAIGGPDAIAGVFTALYEKDLIALLPSVVDAVSRGDYGIIPAIAQQGIPFATGFADGSAISVACADNAELLERDARLLAEPGRYSVLVSESAEAYCDEWAVEPVSGRFHDDVIVDVPTLVLAGRYDPVTPPDSGRRVAVVLPNAVFAEFDGVGHGVLFSDAPCAGALYRDFITTAEVPDPACAADAPSPAFVTG
jgi:pimeloyl-ACP methyl ester carboxylesterase